MMSNIRLIDAAAMPYSFSGPMRKSLVSVFYSDVP